MTSSIEGTQNQSKVRAKITSSATKIVEMLRKTNSYKIK